MSAHRARGRTSCSSRRPGCRRTTPNSQGHPLSTSISWTSTGDGDLDIYKAQGTDSLDGGPNQLLINTGSGNFVDESAARLPPENLNSTKADWGDVDGDGDLDWIVAQVGREQLLLNDGFGVFADGSSQLPAGLPIFADISADARFADVDGDGDLDILVSNEAWNWSIWTGMAIWTSIFRTRGNCW
jgi:hypothetical protein